MPSLSIWAVRGVKDVPQGPFSLCFVCKDFHFMWQGEKKTHSRRNLELKLVLQAEWRNETRTEFFIYFHFHGKIPSSWGNSIKHVFCITGDFVLKCQDELIKMKNGYGLCTQAVRVWLKCCTGTCFPFECQAVSQRKSVQFSFCLSIHVLWYI